MSMQAPYNDPNMNVDWIAERYWPNDPDRDSREARGLSEYYQRADVMKTPSLGGRGSLPVSTSAGCSEATPPGRSTQLEWPPGADETGPTGGHMTDTIQIHESSELIEMIEIGSHDRVDCTTIDLAIVREAIEQLVAYVAVEPESADQLADRSADRISPFGLHTIMERLIEILVAARIAQSKQPEEDTLNDTTAERSGGDPLATERAKVTQAMALLREAREGVDGYGAWAQADALHDLVNRFEAEVGEILASAERDEDARDQRETEPGRDAP